MTANLIVILGGDREKNNILRSNKYSIDRVTAAYYLHKNLDGLIIASSGSGYSKVMKNELIDLGVSRQHIIEEDKSLSTYDQLARLKKIIKKISPQRIILISSQFHLKRITAFIEHYPELKFYRSNLFKLVSAEKIVKKYDPSSKKRIEKLYGSRLMTLLKAKEKNGIMQIKAGNYTLKR